MPIYDAGDVWARTMVRIEEARQSAALIDAAARRAPTGPAFETLGPLRAGAEACGLVEGWRGPIWHWVVAGDDGTLARGRSSTRRSATGRRSSTRC